MTVRPARPLVLGAGPRVELLLLLELRGLRTYGPRQTSRVDGVQAVPDAIGVARGASRVDSDA